MTRHAPEATAAPSSDAPAVGAWLDGDAARFRVWAPAASAVDVVPEGSSAVALAAEPRGYWSATVDGIRPGDRYRYRLDGHVDLPDPASCAQPEGVHGPSALVDPAFEWTDDGWIAPSLADWVCYELHVGTFTPEGTFDAVVPHLDGLVDLGVTTVELMPVAEFPGNRGWGYDGVDLFAAHHAYGGLDGLRRLVDACHARGLAVVLDVVYNHLGPDGNHLGDYGPYFTDRYRTPWGAAVNLDGAGSDEVRGFFVENARFWVTHAHVDGLRLDAVHAIVDPTPSPFVEELADAVHLRAAELGRRVAVVAESADDDPLLTAPVARGGRGLDAQWSDDFHHALHVALTGEHGGYYADFDGLADLAEAFRHGFTHRGRFSPFRGRRHGRVGPPVDLGRLVVFAQNHDQVGNRARGDRLTTLVGFEAVKLAAACTLLAPCIPLLFMGEEDAETTPFPYFTSHTDPALADAVRRGRAREFAGFAGTAAPPDPQDPATFASAVLDHLGPGDERRARMRALCRALLGLRRRLPALDLRRHRPPAVAADLDAATLLVTRGAGAEQVVLACCFADEPREVALGGTVLLDTADAEWSGPRAAPGGARTVRGRYRLEPWSAAVLARRARPRPRTG